MLHLVFRRLGRLLLPGLLFATLLVGLAPAAPAEAAFPFPPPEPQLTLKISDVTVSEPVSGTRQAVFSVNLSHALNNPLTVNFATADSTAKVVDGDYLAKSGTLVFQPGQRQKSISVTVMADSVAELDERFFVNITPTGSLASIFDVVDLQGAGTIRANGQPDDVGGGEFCEQRPDDPRCEDIVEQP